MDKFVSFIENKIAPMANKVSRQKYVQALVNTFLTLIPFFSLAAGTSIIPVADGIYIVRTKNGADLKTMKVMRPSVSGLRISPNPNTSF